MKIWIKVMRQMMSRVAPWIMVLSVFPALILVNAGFLLLFPSQNPISWAQLNPLNPQNSSMQVGYVYQNRSPKEVFANFYFVLGTQLAARGQVLAAESLLADTVKWMPNNATAQLNYGIVLESLDKLDEAAGAYQKALESERDMFQANYNLGLLYDKMGQTELGVRYMLDAQRRDPNNPSVNYDVGVLYAKLNDFKNSALYTELAIQSEKDFAEAYNNYGYALAHLGEYDKALASIETSLKLKPDSAATLDSKGFVYFGMGRYEDALSEYQKALKVDPTIGEIYLHIAQVMEKLHRIPESIDSYEKYIQLTPEAPDKLSVQSKISELKKWKESTDNKPSSG